MIILDTNVLSEPTKNHRNDSVRLWLNRQAPETLYLTATSLAEVLLGIAVLPDGKRRDGLATATRELVDSLFGSRILPFDEQTAIAFARLVSKARSEGKAVAWADGQIAAVALVHGFAVATRDTEPFLAAGVRVIDPWQE